MQTFIAILRGINVSGQKKILMADLKSLFENSGFLEVQTYIQSGNVVFKSPAKLPGLKLAQKIEKAINEKYGFKVPVITRNKEELQKIITTNPFAEQKNIDLKKLHLTFLSNEPEKENIENIRKTNFSPDEFVIEGKEIYLHIPESYGLTKLSNTFFEKKLKVTATTRNWNTVNKLWEMASQ
jgi:uncharacterized protein (DUF1697 family)